MASPHVAGVAALVVGAGVTRPDAVETVLLDSARRPRNASLTWKPWEGFHTFPRFGSAGQSPASPSRLDGRNDHYGSGIADAQAALNKAKRSRGMASLGLGASLALLGLGRARRRKNLTRLHFGSMGAALVLGASGLFFLPSLGAPAWLSDSPVGSGALASLAGLMGPAGHGDPLLWSSLLPLTAIAFLLGVRWLRPTLAGLCFGVAGALLFAACALPADIRFVPDILDRAWLLAHAILATGLGSLVLRR
jgi:serine protease